MPQNIEIKVRLTDYPRAYALAQGLTGGGKPTVLHQENTFFACANGRLKLRQEREEQGFRNGQLIFYMRADAKEVKASDYNLFDTTDPRGLQLVLSQALGATAVVKKVRKVFLVTTPSETLPHLLPPVEQEEVKHE